MRSQRRWLVLGGCVAVAATIGFVPRTHASQSFDNQRGDIAARVSMQNTFQHNNVDSINWVQMRNEVRFDLRYDLIQQGVGQSFGPINALKFNILYRGRYDPVYQIRDSYRRRDYDRGNFEFPEGKTPRELFFDIGFGGALKDLSLRIGKQQVVWGESDLFRSLDVVNPLDLRQNFAVGEDFADFRQPLWIAKALYNFGDVASFWNEAGIEAFFSPNSRPQAYQTNLLVGETWKIHTNQSVVDVGQGTPGFGRNMSLPFKQVRHPWEILRVGSRNQDSPALVQVGGLAANGGGSLADFMYRIKNDVPPSELDTRAIMAGIRLLGTTYGNAYFTLNYLFKRSDVASASAPAGQLAEPGAEFLGTNQNRFDALFRGVNAIFTPDLNGNGIPDGQEEQIRNCLNSKIPTSQSFPGSPVILGNGGPMTTPGVGEIILDPQFGGKPFNPAWHGSVYSDPKHPELDPGVRAGTLGVPAGKNQLKTDHVAYKPVLPLTGFSAVDGLSHASFCQDIPVFHPWTHIIGATMTYNDYAYTGLVFRLEQSYSTKEPGQWSSVSPERLAMQRDHCPPNAAGFPECTGADAAVFNAAANAKDFKTRNKRYYGVWRSMVGFDYLRAIAPQYGHHVENPLLHSLLTDQWFFIFQFLDTYRTKFDQMDHSGSFTDRYQQFNPFFTLAGTGFFMHQKLNPILATFWDANQMIPGFLVQMKYFLTPKLEMRIGEVLYAGSTRNQDDNALGLFADRDNFYVRLTYYFL